MLVSGRIVNVGETLDCVYNGKLRNVKVEEFRSPKEGASNVMVVWDNGVNGYRQFDVTKVAFV